MNGGKADPGGIDGQIYRSEQNGLLTVEPSHSFDTSVHIWAYVRGEEQPGLSLQPAVLRALAADLIARADLIETNPDTPTNPHGATS